MLLLLLLRLRAQLLKKIDRLLHLTGNKALPATSNQSEVACATGVDRTISTASSWMENYTDKDRLLLKHQLCPPFPV